MSDASHSMGDIDTPGRAVARPLVSVIMSMRNSAATIGAAVRSVQLQTLEDWELIVIDDGSSDRSADIVHAIGDERIRLVREPASVGLALRLNQAVALSRGDFIARMDADDVCFPERLARQVERLQQEPQLDLLGCGAVVFTDTAELVGRLPVGLTHQEITAQPFRGFPFPHPTWCGRAAWFRDNPYDGSLVKTQDQDLLLRTFSRSRFAAVEDILIGYRWDAMNLRKLLLGRRTYIKSLWRYARHSGTVLPVSGAIVMQCIKSGVDIVTVGLGFNRVAQRSRLQRVPLPVAKQWQDLRQQLCLNKVVT